MEAQAGPAEDLAGQADSAPVQEGEEPLKTPRRSTRKRKSLSSSGAESAGIRKEKPPIKSAGKKARKTDMPLPRSPAASRGTSSADVGETPKSSRPLPTGIHAQEPSSGYDALLEKMSSIFDKRMGSMETNLGGRIDRVENGLNERFKRVEEGIDSKFTSMKKDLGGVSKKVDVLKVRMDHNDFHLEGKIEKMLEKKLQGDRNNVPPTMRSQTRGVHPRALSQPSNSGNRVGATRKEESYWRARRSIRLWPIVVPDLRESVLKFLSEELLLDEDLCELGPDDVCKVRPGRGGKRNEVAVTLPDIETRDCVRAAARNLSGKPSYGMRLEIPDHLRPSLRNLESVSFDLKKRHPDMKRNIKFDDGVMDLVLDVKLDDSRPWQKIRPEDAKTARRAPRINYAGVQEELDSDAIDSLLSGPPVGPSTGTGANLSLIHI